MRPLSGVSAREKTFLREIIIHGSGRQFQRFELVVCVIQADHMTGRMQQKHGRVQIQLPKGDLATKKRALQKLAPAGVEVPRFRAKDDVLAFLATL